MKPDKGEGSGHRAEKKMVFALFSRFPFSIFRSPNL